MSKNSKKNARTTKPAAVTQKLKLEKDPDYLYRMSHAWEIGAPHSLFHIFPIILFSAVTILIVRLHIYTRPMSQFFWTSETDESQLSDFFSYDKMVFIMVVACFALVVLLFQLTSQSLAVKRTAVYIPMAVYAVFVLISYFGSDYKTFALWGYNDRFEGTIPLLAYMVMLFFVINTVNSVRNIKQILWPIAVSSVLLSLLGITQAADHDFFRTVLGQKLISPNYVLSSGTTLWQAIDAAFEEGAQYYNFTFQNREIYQTVYNINYVSFYLTLLIPLFGMLFVRSLDKEANEPLWKKICLGILCALLIFNFIGSASAGGFFGLGIIGILGIIMLNKQLIKIWKPLVVLFVIAGIVFGITSDRWLPEITSAFKGLQEDSVAITNGAQGPATKRPHVDYIKTGSTLEFSVNGNPLFIDYNDDASNLNIIIRDADNQLVLLNETGDGYLSIDDERFYDYMKIALRFDDENRVYLTINTDGTTDWYFTKNGDEILYMNGFGNLVALEPIEHIGFKNHQDFGSGRGYIWSTSIPLLKHTIIKGFGADTYCIHYPTNDYAGKYNSVRFQRDIIVDKPHNMYLHTGICTGVISLIALVAMYLIYVIQSIKLFWKRELGTDFITYTGFGLFCGLTAFMATGLVDDSTVSVMPLFYTLLGTGFATNILIRKADK